MYHLRHHGMSNTSRTHRADEFRNDRMYLYIYVCMYIYIYNYIPLSRSLVLPNPLSMYVCIGLIRVNPKRRPVP